MSVGQRVWRVVMMMVLSGGLLGVLVACQSQTRIDEVSSQAPEAASLKRVLVVGIDITPQVQQAMERAFSQSLRGKERTIFLASQWYPAQTPSRELVAERVKAEAITGVLVTRLLAYDTKIESESPAFSFSLALPQTAPGERLGSGSPWLEGYGSAASAASMPLMHKAIVETKLYDAATGKVLWQARSRTVMTEGESPDFEGFAAAITRQLKKSGWLR